MRKRRRKSETMKEEIIEKYRYVEEKQENI